MKIKIFMIVITLMTIIFSGHGVARESKSIGMWIEIFSKDGEKMYGMSAEDMPAMPRIASSRDGNAWMRLSKNGEIVAKIWVIHPNYCPIPRSMTNRGKNKLDRMLKCMEAKNTEACSHSQVKLVIGNRKTSIPFYAIGCVWN